MCILPIDIYCDKTNSQVQTYAMLDNCSQETFIKESLINHLKISGLTTSITVKVLNGEEAVKAKAIKALKVAQMKMRIRNVELIYQNVLQEIVFLLIQKRLLLQIGLRNENT